MNVIALVLRLREAQGHYSRAQAQAVMTLSCLALLGEEEDPVLALLADLLGVLAQNPEQAEGPGMTLLGSNLLLDLALSYGRLRKRV